MRDETVVRARRAPEAYRPEIDDPLVINLRDDEIRIRDREQSDRHTRLSGTVLSGPYSSPFVVGAIRSSAVSCDSSGCGLWRVRARNRIGRG
jgi:hypothetical protein